MMRTILFCALVVASGAQQSHAITFENKTVRDVLDELVPKAYSVDYASPEIASSRISFSGQSDTWLGTLKAALYKAGYAVRIDERERVVRIMHSRQTADTRGQAVAANPTTATIAHDWTGQIFSPSWTAWEALPKDISVHGVLYRWSKQGDPGRKERWRVLWEISTDFPISKPARYTGSFRQAVIALARDHIPSNLPADICFYENHIVRITPACLGSGSSD